jgi:hypothetical protein
VGFSLTSFDVQLAVSSTAVVVMVNVHAAMSYCRQAGSASKSQMHESSFKQSFYVAMYWTCSLVLKAGLSSLPELNPSTIDWSGEEDTESQSTTRGVTSFLLFAILNFALGLVCDVVPYLIIVDSQFIKILTFDAHR